MTPFDTNPLDDGVGQPSTVQLLVVGGTDVFARQLTDLLGARAQGAIHLPAIDEASPEWQDKRAAGIVWVVLVPTPGAANPLEDLVRWARMVAVAFRPTRLVALLPDRRIGRELTLMRAGVDGIVDDSATPAGVIAELHSPPVRSQDFFPDPKNWLNSLTRASEELLLTEDPNTQLVKLLRIFVSQLKVDRCSILLYEEGALKLAAAIGMPAGVKTGATITLMPGSITAWVFEHRRSRLVEGELSAQGRPASEVRSALCVPLVARDELLGAVNFSSMKTGRVLTPTDLAAAEVFASLLALTISNHRLHQRNVQSERLAAVGNTTASISHCIKNILVIFKGAIHLLKIGGGTVNAAHPGAVQMIERATRRLENLVMDLLDFAKEREPQLVPVLPLEELTEVREVFVHSAHNRSHFVEVECSLPERVMVDEQRLQRALLNLVNNSIDVMPDGGRILLRAEHRGDSLVFSVSDEGPGVPEDQLANIFAPFYSTKGSRGTGLGLAMVRKFCEENHGSVTAGRCSRLGGLLIELELPYIEAR